MGAATATALKEDGFRVLIADLDPAFTQRRAEELGVEGFAGELTDEATARALMQRAAELGDVTAVVNAAGISPKLDGGKVPFDRITAEDFRRVLDVNVVAMFLVAREAAAVMARDGRSSIVNIGSISARMGGSGPVGASYGPTIVAGLHYAASKAAVHSMGVSLCRELAPYRIRVNTIAPGFTATNLTAVIPPDTFAEVIGQIPSGEIGTPDDIAAGIRYLVSDAARYVNGAVLDINGAWLPQF